MKFRNEYKHQISFFDSIQINNRLSIIAHPDKNSSENGSYLVKSLYFDNCFDKTLNEKVTGLNKREKFRIRYYNDDTSFIKLEKKSKIDGYCLKQTVPVTEEEVWAVLDGDWDALESSEYELIKEFSAKIQYQLLRPKSVVVYDRTAYVYQPGNVRVTLDSNIRGSENIYNFFDAEAALLNLFPKIILEVKWDEFLPQIIRDAVQLNNIKSSSFSKYAATRFSVF